MKNLILSIVFILGTVFIVQLFFSPSNSLIKVKSSNKVEKEYSDEQRIQQEFLMLRDPQTNKIPKNIKYLEQQFASTLPKRYSYIMQKGTQIKNAQVLSWTERGPNNVGGRVRALGIDIRTTVTPTILAGGVSSGLWKSLDGGAT